MVNYKKKYQKIVDELVGESFPELNGKRIWVSEANEKVSNRCLAATYYFVLFSFVKVGRKFRGYTDFEARGVLAHEMGHILRFESCSLFGKAWKGFRYFTSRKARTVEENACDRIAIEKGYARGLASVKKRKRKNRKYRDCYLSAKQVEAYAKEIGKW